MTRTRSHVRSRKRVTGSPGPSVPPRPRAPREREGVRWSRIRTAQTRIDAGYYERADVEDLVVTAVLNELRRN